MTCSTLIRGGRIVDGAGNPWFHGDVALAGDRIAAVAPRGRLAPGDAREVVDADGLVVCPGFIDILSHSINSLMTDGRSLSKVTQGVTTEIMGELWSPAPFGGRRLEPFHWSEVPEPLVQASRGWSRFGDWLEFLAAHGVSVNVGSFLGGGTVREYAKGWDAGPPGEDELEVMRRVTAEAMEDGAFGVATALLYPPNSYSPDEELVEVARVVGRYGGLYISHVRSEGDRLLESLQATVDLAREARVAAEVYHLKATGPANWGKMPDAIALIDRARAGGVDITADMYPYPFSGTGLSVLLPTWAAEGGDMLGALRDPAVRSRIAAEMRAPGLEALSSGSDAARDHVAPIGFRRPEHAGYVGRRLPDIAAERGQDWVDAALDLLDAEDGDIATVFFSMREENLALQMRQPWVVIGSDAGGIDPALQTRPVHPRVYGTFPRVLARYVREEGVLTLEEAVRKMSGATAARLGLLDRGLLRPGCFADVVVLDPEAVADHATLAEPHRLSTGIRDVWVNGERVVADGQHTGALPGRAVYGPGRRG